MDFLTNFFISCKESRIENNKSFYGCFHIGPFEPGQSITIGNALRRTLLSELKGLAITAVEIDGAVHEYSNILGVKDSVLDILLNLKEIVLRKTYFDTNLSPLSLQKKRIKQTRISINKLNPKSRQAFSPFQNKTRYVRSSLNTLNSSPISKSQNLNSNAIFEREEQEKSFAYLKVRGPGVVRASDIRLPSNIQCVDPNQYIATLTEDGFLNIKIIIEEGQKFIRDVPTNFYNPGASVAGLKNTLISNIDKLIPQLYLSNSLNFANSPMYYGGDYFREAKITQNYKPVFQGFTSSFLDKKSFILENLKFSLILNLNKKVINNKIKTVIDSNLFRRLCAQRLFLLKKNLLKIDAIFNPVIKVNYIIEIHENERISSSFENIKNLENSLDILSITPFKEIEFFKKRTSTSELKGTGEAYIYSGSVAKSEASLNFINTLVDLKTGVFAKGKTKKDLINKVNNNIKESVKHKIILEIWTNGSIHPRQALQNALNNLVTVFIKLQKTQIFSNFVKKSNKDEKILTKDNKLLGFSELKRSKQSSISNRRLLAKLLPVTFFYPAKQNFESFLISINKHNGKEPPQNIMGRGANQVDFSETNIKLLSSKIMQTPLRGSPLRNRRLFFATQKITKEAPNIIFKDMEINNTYSLSQNTKDILFQKWLYLKKKG